MRRDTKSFTVEVKRKSASGAKPFRQPSPKKSAPTALDTAEALFKKPVDVFSEPVEPAFVSPSPENQHKEHMQPDELFAHKEPIGHKEPLGKEGRVLQCLVTEAAMDAAKAETLIVAEPERRPRGRPRKERLAEEIVPVRKRGRPKKSASHVPAGEPAPMRAAAYHPPSPPQAVVEPPKSASAESWVPSVRTITRRAVVAGLPRGERWKRRLPKVLR